jgi:C_GCAxxG_C_C family probable redox protein
MNYVDQAAGYFSNHLNCAQSVLATFAPELGLDRDTALRLASGFGSGMARLGQTCGAVTGAIMVLGLRYGYISGEDLVSKEKTYALVQELTARFRACHGSTLCRELLGCDLGTPEGQQLAADRQLFTVICEPLVRQSVTLVQELLARG